MKKCILIFIAFVSTAFADRLIDDLTFEWVDPSQHVEIASELRDLIRVNHSMQFMLLGDAIATYFDEAVAITLAKEDGKIVGFCSINKLRPAESMLEIECAFVDPSYKHVGISDVLTNMMLERYSDCSVMVLMPLGFMNHAW